MNRINNINMEILRKVYAWKCFRRHRRFGSRKAKLKPLRVLLLTMVVFLLHFLFVYIFFRDILTILLLNTTCPVLTSSVDPGQLASTDLDLHCLSLNM